MRAEQLLLPLALVNLAFLVFDILYNIFDQLRDLL